MLDTSKERATRLLLELHDDLKRADDALRDACVKFEKSGAKEFDATASANPDWRMFGHAYVVGVIYHELFNRSLAALSLWAMLHKALTDLGVKCSEHREEGWPEDAIKM